MTSLSALNWNIGNPSRERAGSQLPAVLSLNPDIICLTETKASEGCTWLASGLRSAGYRVHFPTPESGEYGALLASRVPMSSKSTIGPPGLEARAPVATLSVGIRVVGAYVPSNAQTEEKRLRKTRFMEGLRSGLNNGGTGPTLLLADLNSVPSTHPSVPFVDPDHARWVDALLSSWTDCLSSDPGPTWVSPRNEGYRYDYCLARGLAVTGGERLPKLRGPGLSDHMGTWCTLEFADTHVEKRQSWSF